MGVLSENDEISIASFANPKGTSMSELKASRWTVIIFCLWLLSLGGAACDCTGSGSLSQDAGGARDAGGTDGSLDGSVVALSIEPADPVLVVQNGQTMPTVTFQVKANGQAVAARYSLDKTELGTLSSSGLFTPSGALGGAAAVTASAQGMTVHTTVTVKLETSQNGAGKPDGGAGSGGYGGVGGEGPGPAVSNSVRNVLEGTPQAGSSLALLYPYDQTVWPLGQLAPLLQWKADAALLNVADGALIKLSATNYQYKGIFGRPYALASGAPFQRYPIPQDVWDAATKTAAGGTLKLELTISSGGKAYGPLASTWKIARGLLKGVVYYQSYGTNLAKNENGAINTPGGLFGGATLAIKPGKTDPVLVAGKDGVKAGCRVCHSVSADGSRMVVQHGDEYEQSSSYDLKNGYQESSYPTSDDFKFVGLTPDGKLGLTSQVDYPYDNDHSTGLYDMQTGSLLNAIGLSSFVTSAGFPAFSPDGTKVAFNFWAGPGDSKTGSGDGSRLIVMTFDRSSHTFSSPKTLYPNGSGSTALPAWPSFLPTGDAVIFEAAFPTSSDGAFGTWKGGTGELWWTDLATGTPHRLDTLNGKSGGTPYLPTSSTHPDDSLLDYEPTVCPLPSGGYAWVVFMSRRLYGNVATLEPWASDPRKVDLTVNPTPKKLWVAAIDLGASPGTDPSHPPFYLPAQELLAGNSRGFWVVDPCRKDSEKCDSGDQCCNGYCIPGEIGGVCGNQPQSCSKEYDRCSTASDCCETIMQCVNQRCLIVGPGPN